MCAKCLSLVRVRFPHLTDEQQSILLWENTGYPLASPEHLEEQLDQLQEEFKAYKEQRLQPTGAR